jgi:hypothetical protein
MVAMTPNFKRLRFAGSGICGSLGTRTDGVHAARAAEGPGRYERDREDAGHQGEDHRSPAKREKRSIAANGYARKCLHPEIPSER